MLYVANGNVYVCGDDGTVYPVDVSVKEKVTEHKEVESYKLTRKEAVDKLPDSATAATIEEVLGKFVITEDKPLTFDQAKHDEATSDEEEPAKQSEVAVTVKTDGSYLGINFADLGTFQVDGLKITGTAKQATAQGWNGEGQDKTGYFIGLHLEGLKSLKTEKHPEGKSPDVDNDWLILLGEESPSLTWIEVEDNSGKTDRYTVSVTAAAKVRGRKRKVAEV